MKKVFILIIVILIFVLASYLFLMEKGVPEQGSCKQKISGQGFCEAYFEGYQYDELEKECQKVSTSGCSATIPFGSLEECQKECVEGRF